MTQGEGSDTAAGNASRRARRGQERTLVPDADFSSYYGRPIVKSAPWTADIPAYLFLGGLAAGSSLLAAGADLTGRPGLRRSSRFTAIAAISAGTVALVHDLGRPSRFHHMLRVAKPTSPMSVGTWILATYAPAAGLAVASEVGLRSHRGRRGAATGRWAGMLAAAVAPAVAAYTAVLLADTATPAWHAARRELPFLFVGSAAAAAGGAAMVFSPLHENDVARQMAVAGAVTELAMTRRLERSMGLTAETMHAETAGRYNKAAQVMTVIGAAVAAGLGHRSRRASAAAGCALLAGSWCTRFGVFHAGQQSARDPRYTVVPQRQRLDERRRAVQAAHG